MKIAKNTTVTLNYVLKNHDGTVLEATGQQGPISILFGHKMFPQAVEDALEGKDAGDSVKVELEAHEAFGEFSDELTSVVPLNAFENPKELKVGDDVIIDHDSGETVVKITAIKYNEVTVDANHPYAGQDVVYEIGIMNVRATTPEDIAFFNQVQENS